MKTINFCLFSLVFIWLYSCSSEDSPIEQPTDAENTWYELSENQLKGWDEGYTDGSGYYITYETDSLCGLQYAYGEFYQFNLSSCIRQQNSLTAQFVSFSLANLANIFYPPRFLQ